MAIVVVCCVLCYGSASRFSLEVYITRIAERFEAVPGIDGLVEIWTGTTEEGEEEADPEFADTDTRNIFKLCKNFFVAIGRFFKNLWDSIVYIIRMLAGIVRVLPALIPWNATVPISS